MTDIIIAFMLLAISIVNLIGLSRSINLAQMFMDSADDGKRIIIKDLNYVMVTQAVIAVASMVAMIAVLLR